MIFFINIAFFSRAGEAVNVEVQEHLKNIRHVIRDGVALNVNQRGDVLHRFDTMAKYHEKVGCTVYQ